MRAYGVKRKDFGCCPGHDKFPKETYNNRKSKKARVRDKQYSHSVARQEEKRIIYSDYEEMVENEDDNFVLVGELINVDDLKSQSNGE